MTEITIDQKIQLMTLASTTGVTLGQSSADLETCIKNYERMVAAVTAPKS